MEAESAHKRGGMRVIGIVTALMIALAGGAVWCLLQLYLRFDLILLAILIGVLIAWVLRVHGFAHSASGALIAALCTAVTCLYAGYLLAAAKVASFLGLPMRSTLIAIGPDMAAAVTWADLSAFHIGTVLLAVLLSAWRVWRRA